MKFTGEVAEIRRDGKEMTVTLKVKNIRYFKGIEELEKEKLYSIEIKDAKSKRTLEQNRYMWALLAEIDKEINGERSSDAWGIYCDALERCGAKFEFIIAPLAAESSLNRAFRAVKLMQEVNDWQGVFKCYYGSSKMDTKEMTLLIDTILDMAEEAGVETAYYKELLKG